MNRKDPNFSDLTGAIQVRFRELREKGVGAHVRHAPVVLPNEENTLWVFQLYVLNTLSHNINPFAKHLCHSANAHSPSICKVFKWRVES